MKTPHINNMERWLYIRDNYGNHPLGIGRTCKKCGAVDVMPPAYPNDWFDCCACGHSWEPTNAQKEKMQR